MTKETLTAVTTDTTSASHGLTLTDGNLLGATSVPTLNALGINVHSVSSDLTDMSLSSGYRRSFTPQSILVSTIWPGIRQWSLTDTPNDEKAIAAMIAENMADELMLLRDTLADTLLISKMISLLLPRAGVPVRTRQYFVSETDIYAAVEQVLRERKVKVSALATLVAVYSHIIKHALAHMGCVSRTLHTALITEASAHVVSTSDIRKAVIMEAMMPYFSESLLATSFSKLNQNATPQVISGVIVELVTRIEKAIPSVVHRTSAINTAVGVTMTAILDQDSLPETLRVNPVVLELVDLINFMVDAQAQPDLYNPEKDTLSVYEQIEHCKIALDSINAARLFVKLPLKEFISYFGFVPCSSVGSPVNGLVMYTNSGQQANTTIVDARKTPGGGYELGSIPSEHVAITRMSASINENLLSPRLLTGVANIIADDLARSLEITHNIQSTEDGTSVADDLRWISRVVTIGMTKSDVVALAMATARNVRMTEDRVFTYEVVVPDYMLIGTRLTDIRSAIVTDPYEALLYMNGNNSSEPAAMPSRVQVPKVEFTHDTLFPASIGERLDMNVAKPFFFNLAVDIPTTMGSPGRNVQLKLPVLTMPTIVTEETEVPTSVVAYALCREPETARHIDRLLALLVMYAERGDEQTRLLAQSLLVETFSPIITSPAVSNASQRALRYALRRAKVDTRATSLIIKHVMTAAATGTALALLSRFGYVPGERVSQVLGVMPRSKLTARAAITAAIATETVVHLHTSGS